MGTTGVFKNFVLEVFLLLALTTLSSREEYLIFLLKLTINGSGLRKTNIEQLS